MKKQTSGAESSEKEYFVMGIIYFSKVKMKAESNYLCWFCVCLLTDSIFMKDNILKLGLIVVLCLTVFSVPAQNHWKKESVKLKAPVCYGSTSVNRTYVEPPYKLLNRLKSTGQQKTNIIVKYDAGFEADPQAKAAFEAAVQIWEGLISSPVPIYLNAYWEDLDDYVLGSCSAGEYFMNLDFMPKKDTYYPVPMVEKMLGKEITDSATPDIYARFNKNNKRWYFDVDGKTPVNKYDFLSVVLHEIGHGLGYAGMSSGDTVNQVGAFYYSGEKKYLPGILDHYIINYKKQYLIDASLFKNPSNNLYEQFQSGYLLFNKQLPFDNADSLVTPRLYSPSEWEPGSSIDHLDEFTYKAGSAHSLMTPVLSLGEAVHDPGSLSLGMLYEMGWKFIRIEHDKIPDVEKIEDLKKVEVVVSSDYELDSARLFLISSTNKFADADTVLLLPTLVKNKFEATLPLKEQGVLEYYFSAANTEKREFRMPGIAPQKNYSVTFGEDKTFPVVAHEPIPYMRDEDLSVEMLVQANDNLGVNSVKVEYIVNTSDASVLTLLSDSADIYKGMLSFPKGALVDGDSIRYRVMVEDKSTNKNTTMRPAKGYYTISIQGIYEPVKEYFTDFNTKNNDFISSDFSVTTPSGFDNGALHSLHPYKSPEKENAFYEYTAQLKYPIIIKNGGIVTYDEIVLVEPGEPGAFYGADDFWDYVIVEGSGDKGKTWKPLIDGYDSGANKSWKEKYTSFISGNNSVAIGAKDMFIKREFPINEKKNFAVGDTIRMRFRLYSDPFANGWGWCIDNLNIQDKTTSAVIADYSPGELFLYPNPATDVLTVKGNFASYTKRMKLAMYNHSGQPVWQELLDVSGNEFSKSVDMQSFVPGLYLLVADFDNGQRISRKIIKK